MVTENEQCNLTDDVYRPNLGDITLNMIMEIMKGKFTLDQIAK